LLVLIELIFQLRGKTSQRNEIDIMGMSVRAAAGQNRLPLTDSAVP